MLSVLSLPDPQGAVIDVIQLLPLLVVPCGVAAESRKCIQGVYVTRKEILENPLMRVGHVVQRSTADSH